MINDGRRPAVPCSSLCILLVFQSIISFRAVPRVLGLVFSGPVRVPHFTSVINWSLRVGLSRFNSIAPITERWIAIIDCSIDIGMKKALVVLRVKLDCFKQRKGGITLKECECIGVKTSVNWNGELVAAALNEVFGKSGLPVAILKDDGGDLRRGVSLFNERQKTNILEIKDVGHYTANSLKDEFGNNQHFVKMLNLVTKISQQLKHSVLGYLMAPNLGNHSRFLRITKTAKWCGQIIDLMKNKKIALNILSGNLRGSLKSLYKMKSFINRLKRACGICDEMLQTLKTSGLNEETHKTVCKTISGLPKKSILRHRTQEWLDEHMTIHRTLNMGTVSLPVSSDIIESLMGKFKTIIQRCPRAEFNRLVLLFPCLCGDMNAVLIDNALGEVSHSELSGYVKNNVAETMRQARRRVFNVAVAQ